MDSQNIVVRGAREHNLKNVALELPRNKLIVLTGVSGSGKSSFAFDTLYAEGQRRYVESLSNYARQFLGQLPKPDVDGITGLSPAISIQQKTAGRNPRSTVGTITEITDFLRVLFARVGQGYCPKCDQPISAQTREQIIGRILALPVGTRFSILAPVVRGQKGAFQDFFAEKLKQGFVRARVDGQVIRMSDDLKLDKKIKHDIEIVIDRLKHDGTPAKLRPRVAEAVEQALNLAAGSLIVAIEPPDAPAGQETLPGEDLLLSSHYACNQCGISYEPPSPQLFSFNSPQGMCPECDGLGTRYSFDPELLIPDTSLSFAEGAIPLIGSLKGMGRWRRHIFEGVGKSLGIDLKKPWKQLSAQHQNLLLHGSGTEHIVWEWKQRGGSVWKHAGKWEGIVPQLMSQFKKTAAGPRRMQLEKYMRVVRCPGCQGHRLNPQARAVRVGGQTLIQLGQMPLGDFVPWLDRFESSANRVEQTIAGELIKEIRARAGFLLNVGLHYLSLDRTAPTLSGGEAQRIRLAGQIGSGLVGVLYILDEPSIGLHPRDNERLLRSLEKLRDMGNTVIVVEHDEDTMRAADFLVDFGPGPGIRGGEVVAAGPPAEVLAHPDSATAQYLNGTRTIPIPKVRRPGNGLALKILGAKHNNLKNVSVDFPLGKFICVTGVSGSGKSSLVNDVLRTGMRSAGREQDDTDAEDEETQQEIAASAATAGTIEGVEHIDKVIDIDQTPIGRTPRSNPATYIKVWDEIRTLFSAMPEAKVRGYQPGRFSFNRPGGRCEACEGNGSNRLEMDFLADVWVTCAVCDGKRFNRETLQVKYRGKSIHDVLELEVGDALEHFEHVPKIKTMLQTLHDVGLDYLKLGQASPTLSGGEAQRIKLARELCRRSTGKTLYILDEPTTGLHFVDIHRLLEVLHGFVDQGNTVLVIEHNLDVIKTADWCIDLGPEGGVGGGTIVAAGPPEVIAQTSASHTGAALAPILFPKKKSAAINRKATKASSRANELITHLVVEGAEQHNLKNVTARIPRDQMTVMCGPSGSGKSSLAMDTIYAEGQRRYVESLSSYARQFLGQVQKPRVEHISGLSPAIAIEQKTTSKSPRSTVGTITEIYDYLRILYARLGTRHCPYDGTAISTQTADQIIEHVLALPEGTKIYVMAPLEKKGQEKYETLWEEIRRAGYVRMRVDGKSYSIEEPPAIDHRRKHSVEVIVDRNVIRPGTRTRIAEAVEQALDLGRGVIHIARVDSDVEETSWRIERFSQHLACPTCRRSYDVLGPNNYSFNSALGWCPTCEGLGVQRGANVDLLIRDRRMSLRAGAIAAWPTLEAGSPFLPFAEGIARHGGFTLDTPFDDLDPKHQRILLHGCGDAWLSTEGETTRARSDGKKGSRKALASDAVGGVKFQYKGLFPAIDEASRVSFPYRARLEHLVNEVPCTACQGSRLRADAAASRFATLTLGELCHKPLRDVIDIFRQLRLNKHDLAVVSDVVREITDRLHFLIEVGLDYLSLDRTGPTLSGGEAQRIRLASQIGSGLTGVLYVLDEPTIGLHPRDNARLLAALHRLRDLGNTLVLVEHDREVIASADYLLDFGPGAGDQGGEITASGSPDKVTKNKASLTGQYLSGRMAIPIPTNRRIETPDAGTEMTAEVVRRLSPKEAALSIIGARQHNLRNVDLHLPLGVFIAVTGVSGSGKSSLINEVLYHTLARKLHRAQTPGAAHDEIRGTEAIDKIINVDQDPIGNSPSSNPATYTGVFDLIRELFARLPESKVRGYHPRRFSFNQKGGRCEACEGNGQKRIEMHFLPDVWIECDVCKGQRYNPETLLVRYHGKTIADVLNLRISEARELFGNITKIRGVLQTLIDVGLGYMTLGQSAPTMSGGEAQRVKLAAELSRPSTGKTLYLLDEPTTGLHFDDVRKLLDVLQRLVDLGNTVIAVEHNLDVIKSADWVIDMGPEAGERGGMIVAQGTPEMVADMADLGPSHTGRALVNVLEAGPHAERVPFDPESLRAAQDGDLEIAQVGKDEKLPWEADGPRWHCVERITTKGTPATWDGEALHYVIDLVEQADGFSPTNWNHRTTVEVADARKANGWFLHALTGHEGYLTLVFRVARNTFQGAPLIANLAMPPLQDYKGLEHLHRAKRVEVHQGRGPHQEITVTVVKKSEIDTQAFRTFLTKAIDSFKQQVQKLGSSPEDLMPWKRDGEKWHRSEKGFPPGRVRKWDVGLVGKLVDAIREVRSDAEFTWTLQDAITIRLPGISRMWLRARTKDPTALELTVVTGPGDVNLDRLEGLGVTPEIAADRADGTEVIKLKFLTAAHWKPREMKQFLTERAKQFSKRFGE